MTIVLLCATTPREDVESDRFERSATVGISTLDELYQDLLDAKASHEC